MNAYKKTSTYKQSFLVFVLAIVALLWQHAAFAANDPDVTGDGRVNTLDVSAVASCIGRDIVSVTRCACADTNGDRVIDKTDYAFVASKVGSSGYPLEPNACQAIKPNTPPNANAGPDQTVTASSTVSLSASSSSDADGNALTFQWSFVSQPLGSTATLSNPNTVTPGFVIDRPGNYVVQVSVSDGKANSTDTVAISTINSPPVANAGTNQGIFIGSTVTLDGSASSDADGDTLSFRWSFTASIPVGSTATLTGATSVNPTFIADRSGSYQVQLIVNDGTADSAPSTVTISTRNTPPVANAGADQSVMRGATVQLNGVASSDIDGNLLTFAWSLTTRPAGSTATLSTATAVNPTFVADVTGSYVAQLIVNDGFVNSIADTVMITVTPVNVPPTANAGADQSAALGGMVQLNGAASFDPEGAPLGYSWSFTSRPAGSTAPLSAINIVNPVFVVDRVGTYIAQLIVNDGVLSSPPDTLIVTTFNPVPVANAGPDQTVALGTPTATPVTLDGRTSSDANGDALVYSWSFTSVPPGSTATVTNSGASRPTFTPTHAGNYVVQLIVSDGATNSPPDTVMITVTSAPNSAPTANAGIDQTGNIGTAVSLNGIASSDLDGDTLTYQWSFTSRPAGSSSAVLANPTAVSPTFTPDVAGTYTVQLIVNDGTVNSAVDTVTITVSPAPNRAPTANAGTDRTGNVGTAVTLNGSASSDPDVGDTLTYQWSFTSRPAGSSAALANPTAVSPAFTPDVAGAYTVQLIVNDGTVNSAVDTVTITVAASLLPVISITATDAAASELGLDPGTFTITRSGGALNQALTVFFTANGSIINGLAINGIDYANIGNRIIIPANATSVTVTITPVADNLVEGNEAATLTLATDAAYSIGAPNSATVTIADSVLTGPVAETEPNNAPAQAQLLNPIGSGYPVIARYEGNSTDDWYRFEATAGVTYVIELFNVAGVLSNNFGTACTTSNNYVGLYMVVENNNEDEITRQCAPNGVANVASQTQFMAAASGTYYIKVAHNNATTMLTGAYSIRILPKHDNTAAAWNATHEPNNVAANAYQLQVGLSNAFTSGIEARSSANHTVNADVDWYRFEATAGVTYVIELFNVAAVLSNNFGTACTTSNNYAGLYMVVENNNEDEITRQCAPNGVANVASQTQFTAGASSTYYLKVAHNNATTTLTGAYSIRILPKHDNTAAAWGATHEPNNVAANAYQLQVGLSNAFTSGIEARSSVNYTVNADVDWYRFEATAGVTYVIELFNVAAVLSNEFGTACTTSANYRGLYLVVQNNNGNEITRQCAPNGVANVENQEQFTAAANGTYYIKVAHNSAATTLTGAYSIRILPKHDNAAAAWDTTHEPNNVAANAYQLQVGLSNAFTSTIEARSPPSVNYTVNADVDWYRFEATAGVTYVIELFNVAAVLSNEFGTACTTSANYVGLYMVVQNNNEDEIIRQCAPNGVGNVSRRTQFTVTAGAGGTYYIKVAHNNAATTLTGAYSVRVTAQ